MNVRRIAAFISVFLLLLCLGCDDSKDIQNMAYVTGVGIDYVDGKYIAYVQVLNFASVAKTENMELGKEVPIWIGVGEGATVTGALTDMNTTSQLRMFWGHLKVVFLSENLLKKGVTDIYNGLNRYREIRYNLFVFGTKEKMMDILQVKSLFNLSPLESIAYSGAQVNTQRSFILPEIGNRFIAGINEPGNPTPLPSIAISRKKWSENDTKMPLFDLTGAYFFEKDKMKNWMSAEDLIGVQWSQENLDRTMIRLPEKDNAVAVLMLYHPQFHVKPIVQGDGAVFDLVINVDGELTELLENRPLQEIEQMGRAAVKDEILYTFNKGLEKKCDPFKLSQALYRTNPALFHKLKKSENFIITKDSIRNIHVKLNLTGTGKYKGRI
ncbi:Ger(x)C family spore germination protein [Neobacillus mesonae]|nr:Ger(x)C family spore germination protein [Neobacillus mesonae]